MPVGLVYTPTGWVDETSTTPGTTFNAARMNNLESGIGQLTDWLNANGWDYVGNWAVGVGYGKNDVVLYGATLAICTGGGHTATTGGTTGPPSTQTTTKWTVLSTYQNQYSDDSGPVQLTDVAALTSPWINSTSSALSTRIRRFNGVVHLSGIISGGATGDSTICTLPAAYRPIRTVDYAALSGDKTSVRLQVTNAGVMNVQGFTAGLYISLGGLSYPAAV